MQWGVYFLWPTLYNHAEKRLVFDNNNDDVQCIINANIPQYSVLVGMWVARCALLISFVTTRRAYVALKTCQIIHSRRINEHRPLPLPSDYDGHHGLTVCVRYIICPVLTKPFSEASINLRNVFVALCA